MSLGTILRHDRPKHFIHQTLVVTDMKFMLGLEMLLILRSCFSYNLGSHSTQMYTGSQRQISECRKGINNDDHEMTKSFSFSSHI